MKLKPITASPKDQLQEILVGCEEVISESELLDKLEFSFKQQKPLLVKLGADPSRPDIHIGHAVVLNKLRLMQSFGHEVVFIIGDFTGRIGDPTGKNKTRPELSSEEILENAKSYEEQVFKILDPKKTQVVFNSDWLGKLGPIDMIHLMAKRTVQQLIVRDDFAKRYQKNQPIHLHEFLYPILQGYDSVHLKADIELGGMDQKFNLLMGREMQKQFGQRPQALILMPLLEGTDGVHKMSKSLDNYIGIDEPARDIFGKTMSISDQHMIRFYELLSRKSKSAIEAVKLGVKEGSLHPMDAKKSIAHELVEHYYGRDLANEAKKYFEETFSKQNIPQDLLETVVASDSEGEISLIDIVIDLGFAKTRSEVRRVIKQNGLKLDGKAILVERLKVSPGSKCFLKFGKIKMANIIVE